MSTLKLQCQKTLVSTILILGWTWSVGLDDYLRYFMFCFFITDLLLFYKIIKMDMILHHIVSLLMMSFTGTMKTRSNWSWPKSVPLFSSCSVFISWKMSTRFFSCWHFSTSASIILVRSSWNGDIMSTIPLYTYCSSYFHWIAGGPRLLFVN